MKINLKFYLTLFLLAFICQSQTQKLEVSTLNEKDQIAISDSKLPEGKNWKLVWSDEFDKAYLDTSKWDFRLHIMQTRYETWTKDAYELDGKGNLLLKVYEKEGEYYTSQLQTGSNYMDRPGNQYGSTKLTWPIAKLNKPKFVHRYGYYEIRCKLPTQEGWWVAFGGPGARGA